MKWLKKKKIVLKSWTGFETASRSTISLLPDDDLITPPSRIIMSTDHQHPIPPMLPAVFGQFEPISISFLSEVVHHLLSALLTPSPPVFLKKSSTLLAHVIINTCLLSGSVPAAFKHAVVQPLLKKDNLDPSVLLS